MTDHINTTAMELPPEAEDQIESYSPPMIPAETEHMIRITARTLAAEIFMALGHKDIVREHYGRMPMASVGALALGLAYNDVERAKAEAESESE